jgi:hypothetical protein
VPDSSSVPTRGRTLDHAAAVYDFVEPLIMLGKQAEYERFARRTGSWTWAAGRAR